MLLLALAAHGQQAQRIAILNTDDDVEPPISHSELLFLTAKFREIATNILPKSRYGVMSSESIVARLGSTQEQAAKICREATCMTDLGRKISADYIAQARIGRLDKSLTIKAELYDVRSGILIISFTGDSKNVQGLLSILENKAPAMFKTMPGVLGTANTTVPGGIKVEESGGDYALNFEKRFLVSLSTEPEGATLSFDGRPAANCNKTPCKVTLSGGRVRMIAALEQYEEADTTISVTRNEQDIVIKLKPNFGSLEIKTTYLNNIGAYQNWDLTINGKPSFSWKNELEPGKYKVKLSHECYEDINFEAGINKGKTEVFDMAWHIKLKYGGLSLNAEKHGDPVSEPVFVNGKQAGKTPFDGKVPLCSKIEIGNNMEYVNVGLTHNEKVEYTHSFKVFKAIENQKSAKTEEWESDEDTELENNGDIKRTNSEAVAFYLAIHGTGVTSGHFKEDAEVYRNKLSVLLGADFFYPSLWGYGFFFGGGYFFENTSAEGIGELMAGLDFKRMFWLSKQRIALSASLGLAGRALFADVSNRIIAEFIDNPEFLMESAEYLDDNRTINQWNFDIMPAIDLQFIIDKDFSIYVGYMYRITLARSSYWYFTYNEEEFDVPEHYSPLKNPRENISGIPGILRFGIKVHTH
jgi:hypothetical protein